MLLILSQLGLKRKLFLIKGEGVAPQGSFLAHVFLTEVLHACLSLLHLLWCHALEGFLTISVHVDGELVDEVFGLYVGSIRVQDMRILRHQGTTSHLGILVINSRVEQRWNLECT